MTTIQVSLNPAGFLLAATLGAGLLTGCRAPEPYTWPEADPAHRRFLARISQALEQKWSLLDAGIPTDDNRVRLCDWHIGLLVDLACAEPEPVFRHKDRAYTLIKEWETGHKKYGWKKFYDTD